MCVRRWCAAVLLALLFGAPRAIGAQQQDTCATAIPANVDAGVFASDMIALLRRSDTFRAQCERLAASSRVRVKIEIAFTLPSGRAETAIHRFANGAIRADVVVLFGENYRELLAHEFEHVLEQVDGVDLRQEAAQGRAWLLPGGARSRRPRVCRRRAGAPGSGIDAHPRASGRALDAVASNEAWMSAVAPCR